MSHEKAQNSDTAARRSDRLWLDDIGTQWLAAARAKPDADPLELLHSTPFDIEEERLTLAERGALVAGMVTQQVEPVEGAADTTRRFKISDSGINRRNHRVLTTGLDISEYARNPVVHWSHGTYSFPVGTARIDIQGDDVFADVTFDAGDGYAMELLGKIDRGIVRATSIGILVQKVLIDEERGGLDLVETELMEVSIVSVPANPRALKAAMMADETLIDAAPGLRSLTAALGFSRSPVELLELTAEEAAALVEGARSRSEANAPKTPPAARQDSPAKAKTKTASVEDLRQALLSVLASFAPEGAALTQTAGTEPNKAEPAQPSLPAPPDEADNSATDPPSGPPAEEDAAAESETPPEIDGYLVDPALLQQAIDQRLGLVAERLTAITGRVHVPD